MGRPPSWAGNLPDESGNRGEQPDTAHGPNGPFMPDGWMPPAAPPFVARPTTAGPPPAAGVNARVDATDADQETVRLPAPSRGTVDVSEQATVTGLKAAPQRASLAPSLGLSLGAPDGRDGRGSAALATARRRGYAEKMRSVADVDTVRLLSMPGEAPRWQMTQLAQSLWQSRWLRGAVLVVGLVLLLVRAVGASAAFMAPGGGIIGWSVVPTPNSPFVQVTPPPTQHQLTPSEYAAFLVGQLSLDQELGQMMIVKLRGTNPGPDDNTMIASQGAGGILYFAFNIRSADQIRASTSQVQQWASIPMLLCVDQEGGPVNRFKPIVGPLPGAGELTGPDQARSRGQFDATTLHDTGFNLNLAPVVDVGTANPQLVNRTFGSDPQRVATMAGAYLTGLQESGAVTGTIKHFPGLGATTTDPHRGLPVLNRSRAEWESIDLAPYRTLLATQDVRAIMVTHVMIPAVDPDLPSSISPAIVDGTLRQELSFQGVVITDDVFDMAALSARYPGPQAAVLAIKAGADEIIGPSSPQQVQQTKDAMKQAIDSGQLTKERIDLSAQRILTLKIEMGLIPLPKTTTTPTASPAHSPTPSPHG